MRGLRLVLMRQREQRANERKKNGIWEERKDGGNREVWGGSGWLNEEGWEDQGVRKDNKRRVFLLRLQMEENWKCQMGGRVDLKRATCESQGVGNCDGGGGWKRKRNGEKPGSDRMNNTEEENSHRDPERGPQTFRTVARPNWQKPIPISATPHIRPPPPSPPFPLSPPHFLPPPPPILPPSTQPHLPPPCKTIN